MSEKQTTRLEAKIPKAEGDRLWKHLFDHEMTFSDWLREQISKLNSVCANPRRKR